MGTYVGNTLVAGATFNPTLLDFKWADHILNDVSWLRADTFSWQPGNVYIAVQDFLEENYTPQMLYCWGSANTEFVYSKKRVPEVGDILYDSTGAPMTPTRTVVRFYGENVIDYSYSDSGGTHEFMTQRYAEGNVEQLETETIAGITISYCRGANGLKIVPASQESNVQAIYNATGVAWYYVLDATNKRFKLPRSKHNRYAATLGVVGNGISLGLDNGTQNFGLTGTSISGDASAVGKRQSIYGTTTGTSLGAATDVTNGKTFGLTTDPEKSGIIAQQEEDTDQYKYLYFYVGNFTPTAVQQTAGLNAEMFNNKVDVGHEVIAFQVPTAANNYTWYRKYADGWVEQGGQYVGIVGVSTGVSITLPVTMTDANYTLNITGEQNSSNWAGAVIRNGTRTTTGFQAYVWGGGSGDQIRGLCWVVQGMAA